MQSLAVKNSATILSLLQKGYLYLKNKGINHSRINADCLLAYTLNVPREFLYAHFAMSLPQKIKKAFWDLIIKRGKRIPLQYLMQRAEFWSISLKVDERALIPRPETELIVEEVMRLKKTGKLTSVDVGTGCGNIALALAHELPEAKIFATDISAPAIELAQENARQLGLKERVSFFLGDLLTPLEEQGLKGKVDFIVSNPPYVEPHEIENLQPEVGFFEPRIALISPETELGIYRRLIGSAAEYLKKGGYLVIEFGMNQLSQLLDIFKNYKNWNVEAVRKDLCSIPRVISARFTGAWI
jgi:release factor glutamine methyltransferase